jgi:LPXTG-motif cell wall-anchored protein
MAVGVIIIVWNYMRGDSANPSLLFVGLGFIAVGFALATRWR